MKKHFFAAIAMAASACVQATTLDFDAYSISWGGNNLLFNQVGPSSRLSDGALDPTFQLDWPDFTVLQLDWAGPISMSGADTQILTPLPDIQVTARDGWFIQAVGFYLNGTFSATGDATQSSIQNPIITFDVPKASTDRESSSISGGYFVRSGLWQVAGWSERVSSCSSQQVCTGATAAHIELSRSYRSEFGPAGGTTSFNFRTASSWDQYSMQYVFVDVRRDVSAVPEPSAFALSAIGLLACCAVMRRRAL